MSGLDKCFEDGMLKKTSPDMKKAVSSLELSKQNLGDAKTHLTNHLFDWALIAAYTSMFHASRALLYKDGVKERSHYCLCEYVKEKYGGTIEAKYLVELNILRSQRHQVLYGDEDIVRKEVAEVEAESAIALASGFLDSVKTLLKK